MEIYENYLLKMFQTQEIKEAINTNTISIRTVNKGEILIYDEDVCSELMVVISGGLEANRLDEDGNQLIINRFKENDIIGATLLYASNPKYLMMIEAIKKSTVLIIKKEFMDALKNPRFLQFFLQILSDQAIFLGKKIKSQLNKSIRDKILTYLSVEMERQSTYTIVLPLSKKQLAENLGIARTSLSRELKKMQDDGIIRVAGSQIHMLETVNRR